MHDSRCALQSMTWSCAGHDRGVPARSKNLHRFPRKALKNSFATIVALSMLWLGSPRDHIEHGVPCPDHHHVDAILELLLGFVRLSGLYIPILMKISG